MDDLKPEQLKAIVGANVLPRILKFQNTTHRYTLLRAFREMVQSPNKLQIPVSADGFMSLSALHDITVLLSPLTDFDLPSHKRKELIDAMNNNRLIQRDGKDEFLAFVSLENLNPNTLFQQNFVKLFDISPENVSGLSDKFSNTFGKFRDPSILFTYARAMKRLPPEEKLTVKPTLDLFVNSVLDGTYLDKRYDIALNPHLKKISETHADKLELWKNNLNQVVLNKGGEAEVKEDTEQVNQSLESYQVLETDEPKHMLALGTDVKESCLSVTGEPLNNKALVSYPMNGEIKAIVVMEGDRIIARSVLRLGWDDRAKKPVLLLEPEYYNVKDPSVSKAILDMAIEKAKIMGLTLVQKNFPEEGDEKEVKEDREKLPPYNGSITFLQGLAPFTYCDSAQTIFGVGGLKGGAFSIWGCSVVYGSSPVRPLTDRKVAVISKYSELSNEQQKIALTAIRTINLATTTDPVHGENWDKIGYTESIYDQLQKSASARETMYIAQHDSKVVGYVAFYTRADKMPHVDDLLEHDEQAYCSWTAVDDDFRGQGLAIDLKMQIFAENSKFRSFRGHIKKTNAASLRVLEKFREQGFHIESQDAGEMILYTVTKR